MRSQNNNICTHIYNITQNRYEFILFRCKTYIITSNSPKVRNGFYIFGAFIAIAEISFSIIGFIFSARDEIGEFDNARCNFADEKLGTYLPIFVSFDLLVSIICLLLFIMCFRNIKQMAKVTYTRDNNNKNNAGDDNQNSDTQQMEARLERLLFRIKLWSIIAMASTLIAGIISSVVDNAASILLIGDASYVSWYLCNIYFLDCVLYLLSDLNI